jgi:hypothetical protein
VIVVVLVVGRRMRSSCKGSYTTSDIIIISGISSFNDSNGIISNNISSSSSSRNNIFSLELKILGHNCPIYHDTFLGLGSDRAPTDNCGIIQKQFGLSLQNKPSGVWW